MSLHTEHRGRDRPCPGCLLRELPDQQELSAIIADLRACLPEDQRAPDALYEQRLNLCKGCEQLYSGSCRLCGCYVEARAMKAWQRCPDVPPKWA